MMIKGLIFCLIILSTFIGCNHNKATNDVFSLGFYDSSEANNKIILSGEVYPNPTLVFSYFDESIHKVMFSISIDSLLNAQIRYLTLDTKAGNIHLDILDVKKCDENFSAFIEELRFDIKIDSSVSPYKEIRSTIAF